MFSTFNILRFLNWGDIFELLPLHSHNHQRQQQLALQQYVRVPYHTVQYNSITTGQTTNYYWHHTTVESFYFHPPLLLKKIGNIKRFHTSENACEYQNECNFQLFEFNDCNNAVNLHHYIH